MWHSLVYVQLAAGNPTNSCGLNNPLIHCQIPAQTQAKKYIFYIEHFFFFIQDFSIHPFFLLLVCMEQTIIQISLFFHSKSEPRKGIMYKTSRMTRAFFFLSFNVQSLNFLIQKLCFSTSEIFVCKVRIGCSKLYTHYIKI